MTEGAAWSDTVPLNSHWKGENGILSEEKYNYNDVGLLPNSRQMLYSSSCQSLSCV